MTTGSISMVSVAFAFGLLFGSVLLFAAVSNQAWVIFTLRGKEELPEVKRILMVAAPNVQYIDEPQPSNLQRGDIQILLF